MNHITHINMNYIAETFDAKTYIEQFNVINHENEDVLHCENLSHLLYSAILNKFKITISEADYCYFKEYQERMFDLVENLREMPFGTIPLVFDCLTKINPYLPDIIIMQWCLPRSDVYLSKKLYNNKYKQNIQAYNSKMIDNITNSVLKNFCVETLSKNNNVPIHCIDYLWLYMNGLSFDFVFYNSDSAGYIGFKMANAECDDNFIAFGFNMEYLLEMGLGCIVYEQDPGNKGSLKNFLKNIICNPIAVENLLLGESKNNFKHQLVALSKNPAKYFGNEFTEFPAEILALINAQ